MIPDEIPNLIDGEARPAASGTWVDKLRPADGTLLLRLARSGAEDAAAALEAARDARAGWAERTPVERGDLVREIALALRIRREELSAVVAEETGKSMALALGETDAAIEMGFFVAGEGRRFYGRTMPASAAHRTVMTIRRPVGVAVLLISFNTPLPNIAWKVFPSILCGNASILKPSEHAPASAHLFGKIAHECGLPRGVLNVVQGLGDEAGAALVRLPVELISFTGSGATGSEIRQHAGHAKLCMEMGGKNALVVCDDADIDSAVRWALASAFSNAGQRCAAASRIVVLDKVYRAFRERFVEATKALTVGTRDEDFLGPVISRESMERILRSIESEGDVLCGGVRLEDPAHAGGWYVAPTVLENVALDEAFSCNELFGPVTALYQARDLDDAIKIVNFGYSPDVWGYGLTAAVHTQSVHRAMRFAELAEVGVVVVNGGTHGSEPHMGFGGVKRSGNGWKEAGVEALDVYSDIRYVNIVADPAKV